MYCIKNTWCIVTATQKHSFQEHIVKMYVQILFRFRLFASRHFFSSFFSYFFVLFIFRKRFSTIFFLLHTMCSGFNMRLCISRVGRTTMCSYAKPMTVCVSGTFQLSQFCIHKKKTQYEKVLTSNSATPYNVQCSLYTGIHLNA